MQLIHGDCIDEMKKLPDRSIDLFLCDLPYGCLNPNNVVIKRGEEYQKGGRAMTGCQWDIRIDLTQFWEQVQRLMKDDHTPIIHFCNTKFGNELINSKPTWFRYDLVWNKMRGVGFLNANKMPMRSHENIYVFSKKSARYNRIDIEGEYRDTRRGSSLLPTNVYGVHPTFNPTTSTTHRCPLSIIDCQTKAVRGQHPTQKPADLYKWLIERYSKSGDTILDPTAGSFTSCFTAIECGRQAIGIEKDDKFYEKAKSLVKE